MHLTFRQVSYFVATAEAGSISGAATRLNISQSAITESLRELEARTGATLFDRSSKGVTLTYKGQTFLRHSRLILETVADAGRVLKTGPEAISGGITLGVTSLVSGYFLADLLARLSQLFPNISIEVIERDRRAIEQLLIDGKLDVALMLVSNIENQEALDFETLVRSHNRVWLPVRHRLLERDRVDLKDLDREPLIALSTDEIPQSNAAFCRPVRRPHFMTSSVESVRSLVATGAGWAIMPDLIYRPRSLDGVRIEARPIQGVEVTVDVGVAWRRDPVISDQAQIFLHLASEFRDDRPSSYRLRLSNRRR